MTQEVSRAISICRFPIILGPVLIHSHWQHFSSVTQFSCSKLGFITVPFFFLISGYLFFQHYENTLDSYKQKLKKRAKSLLVPYLLWNLIAFLIYAFAFDIIPAEKFFQAFVSLPEKQKAPADGPLWFVQRLMFLCLFAPAIFVFAKKKILAWGGKFCLFVG